MDEKENETMEEVISGSKHRGRITEVTKVIEDKVDQNHFSD